MTTTAVVTTVAGRHDHLRHQHAALARGDRRPDRVVVVSMGDPVVDDVVGEGPLREVATVLPVQTEGGPRARLPLAHARNVGARAALEEGAELLVFLDVDCLPGADLLERYVDAHAREPDRSLLCGPVAYLPPPRPGRPVPDPLALAAARPHPARPAPPPGELWRADDLRLFWSLSFALGRRTWEGVGGFDEAYVGYGAEDTDFAQRAREAGVVMRWVGGALAHHQWHPVSDPPVEHVEDIVRNANLFHRRWGWHPMTGWLDDFTRRGLVRRDGESWVVREAPPG